MSDLDVKGIIFDVDGTLASSVEFFYEIALEVLKLADLPPVPRDRVYAFMRACDDLADGAENGESRLERIEQFRRRMDQALDCDRNGPLPAGPIWPAFRYVTAQFPIDRAHHVEKTTET